MFEIAWEPLSDALADGLGELAIGHWDEAENDHFPLDLDWPEMRIRERKGTFKFMGVRRGGELVGYAYVTIGTSLQHRGTLQAWCEGIYVDPDARGAGALLMRKLTAALAEMGVRRCFMASKPHVLLRDGDKRATLSDLLIAMGWTPFEAVFSKLLRVEDERRREGSPSL